MLEVYVKDIDTEKKKISLGYKKNEDNPWEIMKRDYNVGDVVKVKIVSLTTFGAFAQIIPGVDGLIHISQIARERIAKPSDVLSVGQEVDVKITELDFDRKRISLSIRALLDEESAETEEVVED
jgi:ribosomal protein S1